MIITDPEVSYCTREEVQDAVSATGSLANNKRIDRAIRAGARDLEGMLHRTFFPWTGTRYFDWPNDQDRRAGKLWLNESELISATSILSGGVAIAPGNYFLEPANDGPPYASLNLNRGGSATFSVAQTSQRSIAIAGVFGGSSREEAAGTVAEALDLTETGVDVADGAAIGVGDLIRVDAERMIVTDKRMLLSGQSLTGDLTAAKNIQLIPVASGAAFVEGERIQVDAEQMLILSITGNNLTVTRGVAGTTLAVHTNGTPVYVARQLTVKRGAAGTTAATHLTAAPVFRNDPPSLIREANLALAINTVEQGSAAYGRTIGSGDNQREAGGRGVKAIVDSAYRAYGRMGRMRSV